jgi:lysylphosphatidylglycerol synthetase-like protein (DUF2156 family)
MARRPPSVSVTLIFFILNALIWLALGLIIAAGIHPALPDDPTIKWVMMLLSLGIAAILLGLFFFLRRPVRFAWPVALGFLVVTCLAGVFDDFGWVDLLVLLVNLVPIVLLIKDRAWYLQEKPRIA